MHTQGCRRWFELVRDTATNEFASEVPLRRRRVRGARGRDARGGARAERRARRLPQHLPRPAARRLHGRRGGAERARPDRRASRCCGRRWSSSRTGSRPSRSPGKGRLVAAPRRARYDAMHAHCDVLVVGGGRSGLAAAAARRRGRVILLEQGACERSTGSACSTRTTVGRALRGQLRRSRSSAGGGSGTSARSGSCSRPARSSGRRSSPTTTARADARRRRRARTAAPRA